MKSWRHLRAWTALLLVAATASAHDFWIEPSNHRPVVGEKIDVDLRVGEHGVGEPVARNPARIARFAVFDALGAETAVLGVDNRAPAGAWRAKDAGLFVLGYESRPTAIELEAAKFESYLAEEGLEHVSALRRGRGESLKPGREIYSRSVKSLVLVSDPASQTPPSTAGFDRRAGLPLEIVLEICPLAAKTGDELKLRVWFRGEPLAGALVGYLPRATTATEVRTRTDKDGRVAFKIGAEGAQLVRVCWMVPAPKDSGADWESTWSSLTFDVRTPAAPVPATK